MISLHLAENSRHQNVGFGPIEWNFPLITDLRTTIRPQFSGNVCHPFSGASGIPLSDLVAEQRDTKKVRINCLVIDYQGSLESLLVCSAKIRWVEGCG